MREGDRQRTGTSTVLRTGEGGIGAMLTAADRMQLMPFAQIATQIGGAITVMPTLIVLGRIA